MENEITPNVKRLLVIAMLGITLFVISFIYYFLFEPALSKSLSIKDERVQLFPDAPYYLGENLKSYDIGSFESFKEVKIVSEKSEKSMRYNLPIIEREYAANKTELSDFGANLSYRLTLLGDLVIASKFNIVVPSDTSNICATLHNRITHKVRGSDRFEGMFSYYDDFIDADNACRIVYETQMSESQLESLFKNNDTVIVKPII